MLLERIERFSEFITERKKGELKSSLLLVFGMFAFIITVCWGLLGDPYLVLASVYAWGFGDAAAALIGKRFGKHKIRWKYTDGKKSAEGSTSMYVLSFVTVCIILMCLGGSVMMLLAFLSEPGDKGNVIPGLTIAILGVIANTIFWRKYTRLNKAEPNAILAVQARLYRAKSLVDICVTIALLSIVFAPQSLVSYYIDIVGSVIVAGYLIYCGAKTIRERMLQP